MQIEKTHLEGLLVIRPKIHQDSRGFFTEVYRIDELQEAVENYPGFVRTLHSHSQKNVLRGLHAEPWHKLFYIAHGRAVSAIADVRPDSPTFGKIRMGLIDDECRYALYIPPGFANGFCALSDDVDLVYHVSGYYDPAEKKPAIAWNDPDLAIPWPVTTPILSEADRKNPGLRELFPGKFK